MTRFVSRALIGALVLVALLGTVPADAATPRGRGEFTGVSDERNGFECRTATFDLVGTLGIKGFRYTGPFKGRFAACWGPYPYQDLIVYTGTDLTGATLYAVCGVYTHDCGGRITPAGAPESPWGYFHMEYEYTSRPVPGRPGMWRIVGSYVET
jgi:hypothetical protein